MVEKFKSYLITKFRQVAPTKNAMEYRKKILKQLLDRAQELKIKGISDEEFIYNICIEELGDFDLTLENFQKEEIKTKETKRKIIIGFAVALTVTFALVITYLIVGSVTNLWHPTWLIVVGGIFAGIIISTCLYIFNPEKKRTLLKRFYLVLDVSLLCVFLFLLLQVGLNISRSWQAFLVLPVIIFFDDTILSFIYNTKFRWIELPITIEVFAVMLYVLLGLNVEGFWHPGWILCLVGVLAAFIELTIFIILKQEKNRNAEKESLFKKYKEEDDKYYTSWD